MAQTPGNIFDGDHQRFFSEGNVRKLLKHAITFNEDAARSIDHDFGDGIIANQVFDGPQKR
ncbi:MAG TPA: hypothetical protein VF740_03240 [Candidatus Acidoferrum sp.]